MEKDGQLSGSTTGICIDSTNMHASILECVGVSLLGYCMLLPSVFPDHKVLHPFFVVQNGLVGFFWTLRGSMRGFSSAAHRSISG